MKIIILAAGIGSRLGNPFPKCLTMLKNGCSILHNQVKNLARCTDIYDILVVVGFKKELIMEAFPDLTFVYNDYFDTTNTARSLYKGLQRVKQEDVLWLNGDVVCDHHVVQRILEQKHSCMAVNTARVDEEEVKYSLGPDGTIDRVSKSVTAPKGEAVGINLVNAADLPLLKQGLAACDNQDYFEKGLELALAAGLKLYPMDISDLECVEVDFPEDLLRANQFVQF